jgi:phosphopantothenoylcysteine decarboxylase/phosphopantothenate--cysteine ligase
MTTKDDPPSAASLNGVELLVCVCGGIAAYKTAQVVSALVQRGAGVTVAMTEAATKFVGPLTFQALTGRAVLADLWTAGDATDVQHIRATDRARLVIVAPATANIIGKIAAGIADDLVSTLLMSASGTVLLAPAMNERMWRHPVVQSNVTRLAELGYEFIGPESGWQACRHVGVGRMSEPADIVARAIAIVEGSGTCHGPDGTAKGGN